MDLLDNYAFRYEQTDGTQALLFKMGGKYHFDGKVIVCNNTLMRAAIGSLKPVFDVLNGKKLQFLLLQNGESPADNGTKGI